ncbi:MAG: replication-relaxation family protein [Mycobacteriales bacterium]
MRRRRVGAGYVEWLAEELSERDRAVVRAVVRVRVLTGQQIERLLFTNLEQPSRSVVRRRVLARLVAQRLLTTLERQIGGTGGGSAGLIFALDSAGRQLLRRWDGQRGGGRVRRPWTPSSLFLKHTLAISEVYVRLVEASRAERFTVETFRTEPASWQADGFGGWLKPDAYVVLATRTAAEASWLEVDRGTESIPALRRKLRAYLDFVVRGQTGPDGVVPRVAITVPDEQRYDAVAACVAQLGETPAGLFAVVEYGQAVAHLVGQLLAPDEPS